MYLEVATSIFESQSEIISPITRNVYESIPPPINGPVSQSGSNFFMKSPADVGVLKGGDTENDKSKGRTEGRRVIAKEEHTSA